MIEDNTTPVEDDDERNDLADNYEDCAADCGCRGGTVEVEEEDLSTYIQDFLIFAASCKVTAGATERALELEDADAPESIVLVAKELAQKALENALMEAILFVKSYSPSTIDALAAAESAEAYIETYREADQADPSKEEE